MRSHAFEIDFQLTNFNVSEFEEDCERLNNCLMAQYSNQPFASDDNFTRNLTFIHILGPGSGHGKRDKPSCAAVRGIAKTPFMTIMSKDKLCSAWAIKTMTHLADANSNGRDGHYHNFKQGLPVQQREAEALYRLAEVPLTPFDIPELAQFQTAHPWTIHTC